LQAENGHQVLKTVPPRVTIQLPTSRRYDVVVALVSSFERSHQVQENYRGCRLVVFAQAARLIHQSQNEQREYFEVLTRAPYMVVSQKLIKDNRSVLITFP
jgi:hypothetical protein